MKLTWPLGSREVGGPGLWLVEKWVGAHSERLHVGSTLLGGPLPKDQA